MLITQQVNTVYILCGGNCSPIIRLSHSSSTDTELNFQNIASTRAASGEWWSKAAAADLAFISQPAQEPISPEYKLDESAGSDTYVYMIDGGQPNWELAVSSK
jgi:hypothetical protein